MESFDSSPNYMKATSSFDAKKEYSPGGSECDHDMISVTSSTCGSSVNGPYAPKLSKNGIKHKTTKNKTTKKFGNVKSFRKKAKSRIIPRSHVTISDEDSLLDSSDSSPHYLKATSSSQGKKMVSLSHNNMRILIKKTSFKTKRSLLNYSKVSEDVALSKATYSSTLKDSKFPEPVVVRPGGAKSEKSSAMQVCRYHHCSLHGHCHGTHDPVSLTKRFHYRRRRLLKKEKSTISQIESGSRGEKRNSDNKKNIQRSQIIPIMEQLSQDENGVGSCEEICPKPEKGPFGNGYENVRELDFIEVAFGETSFPERSYRENLDIWRKHSLFEQEFGGTSFGPSGYCLRCSCEQITSNHRQASLSKNNNEIPQNGFADIFKKPSEQVGSYIEDIATSSKANENFDKDCPETPVVFEKLTKKNIELSSASSNSQTSNDDIHSKEERGFATKSTPAGDLKVNNKVTQVHESNTNSSTQEGGKLQFSKQRHISMWHLIHQHMSSNLAVEPTNTPLEGENSVGGENFLRARKCTSPVGDLSDSEMGTVNNDFENHETQLRKMFAIKLVREAIEKILLPEVQDQTSDDQSVTSESTPRTELMERNQTEGKTEENFAESAAADKDEGSVSSNPKQSSLINDNTSSPEIEKNEGVVRKSEKKAPKHWSSLKKWILLQRFIRELEKVKKFNPKKPQLLPLNPIPEAEKVNLRHQTMDGRKNAEEWMLDYAIRQAVGQLAPTQKRKVALLVKAFETVVPTKEDDPQVQYRISRLKPDKSVFKGHGKSNDSENQESGIKMSKKTEKLYHLNGNNGERLGEFTSTDKFTPKDLNATAGDRRDLEGIQKDLNTGLKSVYFDGDFVPSNGNAKLEDPDSEKVKLEKITADETEKEPTPTPQVHKNNAIFDPFKEKTEESGPCIQTDRKDHIRMWHMIYQHVVSGVAEKAGSWLLDGAEDDEVEDNISPNDDYSNDFSRSTDVSSEKNHVSNGFTKSDALKLVKEAVDEILLPEIQDGSCDTQSVTNGLSISDQDVSERNCIEIGAKEESQVGQKRELPKAKNWRKLKKLIILKRSIKALEKARIVEPRIVEPQPNHMFSQTTDHEPEKIDLRNQMMDEKKKAEQWMIDYAVQHIVTRLTPARKRRVSMLVEAFEAVVPLPEM